MQNHNDTPAFPSLPFWLEQLSSAINCPRASVAGLWWQWPIIVLRTRINKLRRIHPAHQKPSKYKTIHQKSKHKYYNKSFLRLRNPKHLTAELALESSLLSHLLNLLLLENKHDSKLPRNACAVGKNTTTSGPKRSTQAAGQHDPALWIRCLSFPTSQSFKRHQSAICLSNVHLLQLGFFFKIKTSLFKRKDEQR